MASPSYNQPPRRVDDHKIVLEPNIPQVFALKQPMKGKEVGQYGSVMYTAIDERKLFIVAEDVSDFHHTMQDMQIQPAEFIKVTRVKHGGRGGGYSIRVERVPDDGDAREPVTETQLERDLTRSIEAQRERIAHPGAGRNPAPQSAAPRTTTSTNTNNRPTPETAPPATAKGTMTGLLAGALMASVDAYVIAADYARSKGIGVEMNLDITGEDIRSSATAMLIQYWREDGTR